MSDYLGNSVRGAIKVSGISKSTVRDASWTSPGPFGLLG